MLPTFQLFVKALDLACRTHIACELLRDGIDAVESKFEPRRVYIETRLLLGTFLFLYKGIEISLLVRALCICDQIVSI